MQPARRKTRSDTALWTPLIRVALVVVLSSMVGCAEEGEPEEEEAGPPPVSAVSAVSAEKAPQLLPPQPVEPPNPATHRPPMDNPGGLNRFRPARPIPGLE